jgi:hypothetical protein
VTHFLHLLMMGGTLLLGAVICGALLYPLFRRHFAYMDAHPRWFERDE